MAAVGVASTIFEFLADSGRGSLELPPMSAGQRQSVKKLLQQHPELRCESYGFGEERRIHLFKAWCTGVKEGSSLTLASLAEHSTAPPSEESDNSRASEESDGSRKGSSSPASSHRDCLPQGMKERMQVRNTFIHFDEASVDERAIQSMPRNMFSQCISVEYSRRTSTNESPAPTSSSLELEQSCCPCDEDAHTRQPIRLKPGALVVLEGLVKLPTFNGQSAVVQGWDEATGRYDILIVSPTAVGGCQQAKIKDENLRLVLSYP